MRRLFCALILVSLALPARGAYVVRIKDLRHSTTPPNPIKVAGRVTSVSPLKLSDGSGEITVAGVSAELSDFLVVTGDWDGQVLTVSEVVTNYVGPAGIEMVYVPAGWFLMGNNGNEGYVWLGELPQHWVYLSPFWISKYDVTRGEYRRFMEAGGYDCFGFWSPEGWLWKVMTDRREPLYWGVEQFTSLWGWGCQGICPIPPSLPGEARATCCGDFSGEPPFICPDRFEQTDRHPVVGVSYFEAEAFCNWAGGRLPTEAQWEKAARWVEATQYPNVYPWGDEWDMERCNHMYDTNPAAGGYNCAMTAPVGSYPQGVSPYGLHDMAGNVWEWCRDWYDEGYYSVSPAVDPQGPLLGTHRVLRGGGYWNYPGLLLPRCSRRYIDAFPLCCFTDVGIRLVREVPSFGGPLSSRKESVHSAVSPATGARE